MDEIDRQYEEHMKEITAALEEMACSLDETSKRFETFLRKQQERCKKEVLG